MSSSTTTHSSSTSRRHRSRSAHRGGGSGGDSGGGGSSSSSATGRRSSHRATMATSGLTPVPESRQLTGSRGCSSAGSSSLRSLTPRERQAMLAARRASGCSAGGRSLQQARTADVVFLVDCTASMDPHIQAAAETVSHVLDKISTECGNVDCRAGIVGYRDHCEAPDLQYDILPLTADVSAVSDTMAALAASGCFGGGDGPENVHGGLNEALALDWRADARVIIHIADAPCHGKQYHHAGLHDDHPNGFQDWEAVGQNPETMTAEALIADMVGDKINYCFLRITAHTDTMLAAFRDIYRSVASGTGGTCHFSVADIGKAPATGDGAAWAEFTARFGSLLRGSLRDSIMSTPPGLAAGGGRSGRFARFADRSSSISAHRSCTASGAGSSSRSGGRSSAGGGGGSGSGGGGGGASSLD